MLDGPKCRKCRSVTRGGLHFCMNCGYVPAAGCPVCRSNVKFMYMDRYSRCPSCGAPRTARRGGPAGGGRA